MGLCYTSPYAQHIKRRQGVKLQSEKNVDDSVRNNSSFGKLRRVGLRGFLSET